MVQLGACGVIGGEDLDRRFAYHPPTGGKGDTHAAVRTHCRNLAEFIDVNCPDGREKALAVTSLEETMMWANAAIARNPEP